MVFKRIAAFMAVLMVSMMFMTACSKDKTVESDDASKTETTKETKTEEAAETTEPPTELTMAFITFGTIPADMQLVEDEINKIALQEINAKVKLMPISIGAYQDQVNLMLSSGEKLDLLAFFVNNFTNYVSKGQLLPIDDLLAEYGQGIVEQVGQDYMYASKINGEQYAVTTNRDLAQGMGLVMRQDIVEKYNIDVSAIKTLEDVEAVLKIVKENEPDLVPMVPAAVGMSIMQLYNTIDGLGDGNGVLLNYGEELKVVNYTESQEYADKVALVREWYEKGYILEDTTTTQEAGNALMKAGRAFSYFSVTKPGYEQQEERMSGVDLTIAEMLPAKTSTSVVQTLQWGLPINCENPEKAMQFLNLMYSNADVANLLCWGIEGKHYVVNEGNIIDYPEGIDATTTGYGLNMGWEFGNQFITYVWNGDDPELWNKMREFNNTAHKSNALGFTYDSANVKNEVAACANVTKEYAIALESGVVDPAEALPEYLKALKDAGIDKIIEEKQKQLDAWASQQ